MQIEGKEVFVISNPSFEGVDIYVKSLDTTVKENGINVNKRIHTPILLASRNARGKEAMQRRANAEGAVIELIHNSQLKTKTKE